MIKGVNVNIPKPAVIRGFIRDYKFKKAQESGNLDRLKVLTNKYYYDGESVVQRLVNGPCVYKQYYNESTKIGECRLNKQGDLIFSQNDISSDDMCDDVMLSARELAYLREVLGVTESDLFVVDEEGVIPYNNFVSVFKKIVESLQNGTIGQENLHSAKVRQDEEVGGYLIQDVYADLLKAMSTLSVAIPNFYGQEQIRSLLSEDFKTHDFNKDRVKKVGEVINRTTANKIYQV